MDVQTMYSEVKGLNTTEAGPNDHRSLERPEGDCLLSAFLIDSMIGTSRHLELLGEMLHKTNKPLFSTINNRLPT